jgi:hypothetical protein
MRKLLVNCVRWPISSRTPEKALQEVLESMEHAGHVIRTASVIRNPTGYECWIVSHMET